MAVGLVDNNAFVQQIIDRGIAEASGRNTGELGKQDFLNLLVLQLRYQDPLNPVEDKEFIAQMAQFSALEQMQAMNASNTAMKGFSMIGKYVTALTADSATGRPQTVEGHVESVIIKGSSTFLTVGGKEIPIDSVYHVADGYNPLNSTLSAYTGLIGYYVKGAVFDLTTGEIVGINGEVTSLVKGSYEDYAMLDGVDTVIAGINVNGTIIEDRAKIREYLDGMMDKDNPRDRRIEVFITDDSGNRVPVGALLRSYEYDKDFGTIKAVLDEVAVPVASVASIQKGAPAKPDNAGGDKEDGIDGGEGAGGTDGYSGGIDGGTDGVDGADGVPGGAAGVSDSTDGAAGVPDSTDGADGVPDSTDGADGADGVPGGADGDMTGAGNGDTEAGGDTTGSEAAG